MKMFGVGGAGRHAPVLVDNRWMPGPDDLAVFFGVDALSGIFVKTLRVPPGARAWILQGSQSTEVPQGEYEIEGFFTRLNHLLRDQHAEILVTRSSALPVDFAFDDLPTSEHLKVAARLALSVRIENVPAFARHFMTAPGTIGASGLRALLIEPVRQLAAEFTAARSLRDLAGAASLRPELDQHLQGGLNQLLAQFGLAVARVDTLELRHDKFDANRERIATLWLAADDKQVQLAHAKQLDDLYTDEEWQRIRRAEQQSRLDQRRAELTLDNAERAHALRVREIELYGRIVESRTRKQAIERGAIDAVKALEHELAGKRGARLDQDAEWAHLRELAAIRMRTELEVARQDAAEARTVAQQRFAHALLQQQIRNKVEQARGIEDAVRRRAELARLREDEEAAAAQARAIDAEEHASRLKLLALSHQARRRQAERVQEWEEAQAGARLRTAERSDAIASEEVRQQLDALRRAGGQAEDLARHDKLLRTIEADTLHARSEQDVRLEGEERRAAIRAAEREAEWQHALRRLDHERERAAALGAMDDSAKLALAPAANAALLADYMKTRVHAGMSAEQLAALAGVVGAANAPGSDALRLARQEAQDERERREREVDKDRRHQLDLLALQNDVNKAALASNAHAAAAGGGPAGTACAQGAEKKQAAWEPAGTACSHRVEKKRAAWEPAGTACSHTAASAQDRFCGACGAALPARG